MAQTHENIRLERQADNFSICRMGISCDSRHLYESNWTLHSSVICISKKKIWNKNWWMAHCLDQSTCAIPRSGYRVKFFSQWFLHFSKHTKPTKEDPVILGLDGHYSHPRNVEVVTLAWEKYVYIICLSPHNSHKMPPLDKAFIGPLKTFCCQEIEKWLRSHAGRVVAVYQIGKLFGNAYKQATTAEIAANGLRATGLFPCDKNIFRP